jgi:hypothetical protein
VDTLPDDDALTSAAFLLHGINAKEVLTHDYMGKAIGHQLHRFAVEMQVNKHES